MRFEDFQPSAGHPVRERVYGEWRAGELEAYRQEDHGVLVTTFADHTQRSRGRRMEETMWTEASLTRIRAQPPRAATPPPMYTAGALS